MRKGGVKEQDAEDVAHEVVAALIRAIPGFEHNGRTGAFRNWFRTLTVHRIKEYWRQNRPPHAVGGSDFAEIINLLSDKESPLSIIWNKEHDRHLVMRMFKHVSPRFRDNTLSAFRRVKIEGEDPRAVAEDLDMTLAAVHVANSKVMKAVREEANGFLD